MQKITIKYEFVALYARDM